MFQRRLLRTASFRLALLYALLFGISVLLLGAVTFWSTRAALEDQLRRRIEAEMSFLQEEFRSDGIDHLVATVQERTRTPSNLDYFVLDPAGKRLAGDLPMVSGSVGWVRTKSGRDADGKERTESERIEALVSELQGGYRLGVGEDLEQVREIEDTFLTAFASALSVVLLLGIGGGLLLSAGFLRRVETITRTADAIIAGDISRRIERNVPPTFTPIGTLDDPSYGPLVDPETGVQVAAGGQLTGELEADAGGGAGHESCGHAATLGRDRA